MNELCRGIAAALIVVAPPVWAAEPEVQAGTDLVEIGVLMKRRGEDALAVGDISGGRRLMMAAAAAGDVEAERIVGNTYDPVWLARHNVTDITGLSNPRAAYDWYKHAAADGDPDSQQRFRGVCD